MSSRRRRWRWALAAAVAYLGVVAAHTPPSDDRAAFARLLSDPAEQQHVIDGAGRSPVMVQNPCADARFAIEKKYVPYKPAQFDADGKVLAGAWKQIVEEQGCGVSRLLNVVVMVKEAGNVSVVPVLPGATHADPVLQVDAFKIAAAATATAPGGREANCNVLYVADTEYLGEEGEAQPGSKGRPWRERWTLQSCTQKMVTPVLFIPDSTGTSISAGPGPAIQIVPLAR